MVGRMVGVAMKNPYEQEERERALIHAVYAIAALVVVLVVCSV